MPAVNITNIALSGNVNLLRKTLAETPEGGIYFEPNLADIVAMDGRLDILQILSNVVDYRYETRCLPSVYAFAEAVAKNCNGSYCEMLEFAKRNNITIDCHLIVAAARRKNRVLLAYILNPRNDVFESHDVRAVVNQLIQDNMWDVIAMVAKTMTLFVEEDWQS